MANSFNGIGTTFYGQCAFEQDGSFITTKWFVLFFFPCVPMGSLRVQQLESKGIPFLSRSTGYNVIEQLPTHWPQVLRTWGFVLFYGLLLAKVLSFNMPPLAKFIFLAAGAFLPYGLRAIAKFGQR
ncbi:MAG: hypothetical protein LCI02_09865 [Proteobacteria bacterium]|nr:hypothetical protein [Pseudomonadota bacterium]